MGKKLITLGFLLSFGLALYVFFSRDTKSLRENLMQSTVREPRVVLEDFTIYRYERAALAGELSARVGHFYEPNVVELNGEVRGVRMTEHGPESIGAESATGYFQSSNLTTMMQNEADLERAELSGFVSVGVKQHTLTTDFAEYLSSDHVVRSSRPVHVEGPNRVFSGEEGFTYSLRTRILEMAGLIKGAMTIDEKS